METVIAAVAGELVSRFISFTINKYYSSFECLEKGERLQRLLMRVHTIVEEADARYITNSGMLMQLKILSEAMYQGYHALDALRFQLLEESYVNKVSESFSASSATRLKRCRTILAPVNKGKVPGLEVNGALENLETVVSNIAEFVVLLGGCEHISRRPYDAYLHIDNFMFGRHTEKQKLLNFLLQHDPDGSPAVLPIIGQLAVGKKTLVAHVCADERIRSQFPSILHLNGDNFLSIVDQEKAMLGTAALLVVEFVSDVDEMEWKEFYSFVTRTNRRSKVVIISKLERLARFGSVRPIFLNTLPYVELWYLFKVLAFGSADPAEYPRLVQIAEGFAKELHLGGSLVAANALADVLRRNLNAQAWFCILNRCKKVTQKNIFAYGQHPKLLFEQGHEVDLTDFALCPVSPLRIIPCTSSSSATYAPVKELPQVTLEELLLDPSVRPKGEFNLLSWESKLPPYTSFIHFVPNCTEDMPEGTRLSRRKRRELAS